MEQVGLISSNISRTTWSNSNTELVDDQMRASSIHRVALDKAAQEEAQHGSDTSQAHSIPREVPDRHIIMHVYIERESIGQGTQLKLWVRVALDKEVGLRQDNLLCHKIEEDAATQQGWSALLVDGLEVLGSLGQIDQTDLGNPAILGKQALGLCQAVVATEPDCMTAAQRHVVRQLALGDTEEALSFDLPGQVRKAKMCWLFQENGAITLQLVLEDLLEGVHEAHRRGQLQPQGVVRPQGVLALPP